MYRSTVEADRARIRALEEELAATRAELAEALAEKPPASTPAPPAQAGIHPGWPLLIVVVVLGYASCIYAMARDHSGDAPDEETTPAKVLRTL